jgi:hypothetical protein
MAPGDLWRTNSLKKLGLRRRQTVTKSAFPCGHIYSLKKADALNVSVWVMCVAVLSSPGAIVAGTTKRGLLLCQV